MGTVGSSLRWVRDNGVHSSAGQGRTAAERRRRRRQQRRRLRRQHLRREQERNIQRLGLEAAGQGHGDTVPSHAAAGYGVRIRDLEEGAAGPRGYERHGYGEGSAWSGDIFDSDLESTDSDNDDDDDGVEYGTDDEFYSASENERGDDLEDEEKSHFEDGEGKGGLNDAHPLYFGPAFHPVTEQTPAQVQLQRQIEQQLEQQQRQEYWHQQHRQQMILQERHQQQQQQQLTGGPAAQDFVLPAISGLGLHSRGPTGEPDAPSQAPFISPKMSTTAGGGASSLQDQLYRNSNLYNLISGLSVNPLLTEVQRAGTLDLSVLEQELDDVEGGWFDIEDEDDIIAGDDSAEGGEVKTGDDGIIKEMQPTMRSPTALACSVNLKKSTLRLVKNVTATGQSISAGATSSPVQQQQQEQQHRHDKQQRHTQLHARPNYRLDFTFDSLAPCEVKLFWVVKEVEEDGDLGFRLRRLHHLPQPTTYHFPAGLNQRFISPILPLYTMSLPELTMQGLPSTSMRMFQKRQQQQWQQWQRQLQQQHEQSEGPKNGSKNGVIDGTGRGNMTSALNSDSSEPKPKGCFDDGDEEFKAIMEDQYYPLVIVIEATKESKVSVSSRSLPTPAVDSPGLYLVENQAISTFACFNISSEGGFEIKVMKQKAWINSTNYLIQEIYGFTDSTLSAATSTADNRRDDRTQTNGSSTSARQKNTITRSLSRLSRAESIASRVTQLTMDPPKKKSIRKQISPAKGNGHDAPDMLQDDSNSKVGERHDSTIVIEQLDVASTSIRMSDSDSTENGPSHDEAIGNMRRKSSTSIASSSDDGRETRKRPEQENAGGPVKEPEQTCEDDGDDKREQETEEEEHVEPEPNLVLLDAPECVICLSDVKDTIVLPCRHFCICSECGDVLRRRAPQRCPICRQVFQALLHIASKPKRMPKFAVASAPEIPTSITVPPPSAQPHSQRYQRL
ncbi:hypothetical protein BGZ94_006990 [Podila epigama]|nr:hypothetical protein BGZ94_006990 [Podila epigama]